MNINIETASNMDFVQRSGVKIPNSVIVSGVTQVADQDEQLIDFLKKYGSIKSTFFVDDDTSDFHQNLIVEFSSGIAVESLRAILPHSYTVRGDPSIVYTVTALSSVYQAEIGGTITKTYLTDLKALAKQSGIEYEQVLKEMMSQISEDIQAVGSLLEEAPPAHVETTVATPQHVTSYEQQPPLSFTDAPQRKIGVNVTGSVPAANEGRTPSLSVSDINPPEIQKVVVEHIVRREGLSPYVQSPVRLRSFS